MWSSYRELLKLNYNYVKNNLELVHNGVNENQNIKGKDTDALFENDLPDSYNE